MKGLCGTLLAAALIASSPSVVWALELVPGGYGAVPVEDPGADSDRLTLGSASGDPTFALEFTPRGGGALWSRTDEGTDPGLRFDLTVHGNMAEQVDRLGLATSRDALRSNSPASPAALTIGGAMRWSDWSIGGGLGRAQVLGEDVDLMSASLGYGPLTAELAYGQAQPSGGTPSDVLMLSTDLAAWSWLTLESNLAVGSRTETVDGQRDANREPVAAGRFGLRLNF